MFFIVFIFFRFLGHACIEECKIESFHAKCIEKWLKENTKCPWCRQEPFVQDPVVSLNPEHGYGIHTSTGFYTRGDRYEGQWQDYQRHGQGVISYADGGSYEGEWQNGNFHGQGTRTWTDGAKYEGQWEYGEKHGQGTHSRANGSRYQGQWQNGNYHGQGTYTRYIPRVRKK